MTTKDLLKKVLGKIGIRILLLDKNNKSIHDKVISLQPKGKSKGSVLVCYMIEPFLLGKGEKISTKHAEHQRTYTFVQTLLSLGYSVDVISKQNRNFIPKKRFEMFLGTRTNFQRISERLNGDCIKIMYMDMAHWLYNNMNALQRCFDIKERRGLVLGSYKVKQQDYAERYADYIISGGNEYNIDTYKFANKPIFHVPSLSFSVNTYEFPEEKDFREARKKFVWFGSSGLVHKGLDLVLEAFAELPNLELYVCGPISGEPEFEEEYYKELYNTPNIKTIGWLDIDSEKFKNIMTNAVSVVFPSCSEAGCESVLTCMQTGLIPIVSYESSVNIDSDYGILLKGSSIEEIIKSVLQLSELPAETLNEMSRSAWHYARENHTKEKLLTDFKKLMEEIFSLNHEKKIVNSKNMGYRETVKSLQ